MKKRITNIRKAVCTMANELHKKGITLSQAFKRAWNMIKNGLTLKAAGVTYNNNQGKLQYLAQFKPSDLKVVLRRDRENEFDTNAVKIIVQIPSKGIQAQIGFLPATAAAQISKVMDKGLQFRASVKQIMGGYDGRNYGLLLSIE